MLETGYFIAFTLGLLGGVHCVAMCGGIVGALSLHVGATQPLHGPGEMPRKMPRRQWPLHLAYNLGRIASYTLAGALLGAIGSASMLYGGALPVQITLYVLANLMLIALGLYLVGLTRFLAPAERMGQILWRRIQPLTRRFLPVRSVAHALPLGALWGFLPCGMVYSVLATAFATGSGWRGAGVMLAFGLGTLPNLLLAGLVLARFRRLARHRMVRLIAGLLVLGFGVLGLLRAPDLGGALWQGVICA